MATLTSNPPAREPAAFTGDHISHCVQSYLLGQSNKGDSGLFKLIAWLGKASGENASNVLEYGLAEAIKALGGTITGQQLARVGLKLVEIAQASGEEAGQVLIHGLNAPLYLLGRPTTEQRLLQVLKIAQASGPNAFYVIGDGLPRAIKALGGTITDQQLARVGMKLTEIARGTASLAQVYQVVNHGFDAAIEALGGTTTEEQLLQVLKIAQASGENACVVLKYGLPAVIKALGGTSTEQQLAGFGTKLVEIARASGARAGDVLQHGLPTIIDALGGTITEQQLVTFGAALAEIAQASGKDAEFVFSRLLGDFRDLRLQQGETITERELLQVVKIAQASGKSASNVLLHGLPGIIWALGGTITEGQLFKVAEIAQASGKYSEYVLCRALEATIEALGGRVTEQKLARVGMKLVEIAQASGENAGNVLQLGLPEFIKALGGRVIEPQLARVGMKLVEIAQASGKSAGDVFQRGIPAVIAALSNHSPITILDGFAQHYAGRVGLGTPIPAEVISAIEASAKLTPLVFGEDQKFETPKKEFAARFARWLTEEAPVVLTLPSNGVQFTVYGRADAQNTWRLIPGQSIDTGLLNALKNHLAPLSADKRQDRVRSLLKLAQLAEPAKFPEPGSQDEKTLLFTTLGTIKDPRTLGQALKTLRPLLPELTGVTIPTLGTDPKLEQIHGFLTSVKENFSGHIPETLRANGIKIEADTASVVFANFTRPITGELNKLRLSAEREQKTIKLVATKGIYDAFYDAIGENCAGQYGFALRDPNFQPIRLIDPESNEHYGVVYALKGNVDGTPTLILAGVEIRKKYAYSISQTELMPKLIAALKQVAVHNDLSGGVWTTVGKATKTASWSDDGRIGQYDVVRKALVEPGIAAFGAPRELTDSEQIQFPPAFPGKITRLVRVG